MPGPKGKLPTTAGAGSPIPPAEQAPNQAQMLQEITNQLKTMNGRLFALENKQNSPSIRPSIETTGP